MSKYTFGRKFEYQTKQTLESLGFFVMRSSGSHGIIDILAIKKDVVFAIQIKATSKTKQLTFNADERKLKELIVPFNFVKIFLIFYKSESEVTFKRKDKTITSKKVTYQHKIKVL